MLEALQESRKNERGRSEARGRTWDGRIAGEREGKRKLDSGMRRRRVVREITRPVFEPHPATTAFRSLNITLDLPTHFNHCNLTARAPASFRKHKETRSQSGSKHQNTHSLISHCFVLVSPLSGVNVKREGTLYWRKKKIHKKLHFHMLEAKSQQHRRYKHLQIQFKGSS